MANLEAHVTVFAEASDELKAFIRAEVRKALVEILQEEPIRKPYRPPMLETKKDSREDLPDWARLG